MNYFTFRVRRSLSNAKSLAFLQENTVTDASHLIFGVLSQQCDEMDGPLVHSGIPIHVIRAASNRIIGDRQASYRSLAFVTSLHDSLSITSRFPVATFDPPLSTSVQTLLATCTRLCETVGYDGAVDLDLIVLAIDAFGFLDEGPLKLSPENRSVLEQEVASRYGIRRHLLGTEYTAADISLAEPPPHGLWDRLYGGHICKDREDCVPYLECFADDLRAALIACDAKSSGSRAVNGILWYSELIHEWDAEEDLFTFEELQSVKKARAIITSRTTSNDTQGMRTTKSAVHIGKVCCDITAASGIIWAAEIGTSVSAAQVSLDLALLGIVDVLALIDPPDDRACAEQFKILARQLREYLMRKLGRDDLSEHPEVDELAGLVLDGSIATMLVFGIREDLDPFDVVKCCVLGLMGKAKRLLWHLWSRKGARNEWHLRKA